MTSCPRLLPDRAIMRALPERAPLVLLLAIMELADHALRSEHPRLREGLLPPRPPPPRTERLAQRISSRLAEMRALVARYNAAVDDALGTQADDDTLF